MKKRGDHRYCENKYVYLQQLIRKTYKITLETNYAIVEIFVINVQQCDHIEGFCRFKPMLLAEKFYLPKHFSFLPNKKTRFSQKRNNILLVQTLFNYS